MQLKIKFTYRNHNTFPWTYCLIWCTKDSEDSYTHYHTAWERNRYVKQLTSPGIYYLYTLLEIRILNMSWNGVIKAPNPDLDENLE